MSAAIVTQEVTEDELRRQNYSPEHAKTFPAVYARRQARLARQARKTNGAGPKASAALNAASEAMEAASAKLRTRSSATTPSSKPNRTAAKRRLSKIIREWAKSKGIDIPDKGRIPTKVIAQYEAEHK